MTYPRIFELSPSLEKGILGELNSSGVVSFAIQAGPSSPIRGTDMFNRMMDYFGDEVRAINCLWRTNAEGLPSTNIEKVNELTARGATLDEAVMHAWTVTRAAKRGFRKVQVMGRPEGITGAYTRIEILIEKD